MRLLGGAKLDENVNGKLLLAKKVGKSITKEQFEKEMLMVYQALSKCWELSYT